MPPSLYKSVLAQVLANNGTETTVYVGSLLTLTNESINFSEFTPFTRGIIMVDPESQVSAQPEIISFTGIDTVNLAFTGCTRGLSAISSSSIAANKVYHPVNAPVIISWGAQNISDLISYVNGIISGTVGNASDTNFGVTKLTQGMGALPRAKHALVSQQSSPGMMLAVQPFSFVAGSGVAVNFAGGNTPTITAPVSNPRIDVVVYSTSTSAIAVRTGTEGASPVRPTLTDEDIALCAVYNIVGETSIKERTDGTNGYIQQWYEPSKFTSQVGLIKANTLDAEIDQSQTTQNSTYAVGAANSTTNHSLIGEKFVPTKPSIKGVKLYKAADTGSFTGTVIVSLQADSSGSPSGTTLASFTISNAAWLKLTAAAEFAITFSTEYESMVVGSPYWIVISCSTNDSSNHPNFGINTAGGYASGQLKFNNSTDGWVSTATSILYFKTTEGILGKIVETDSITGLIPAFIRPYSLISTDTTSTTITNSTSETVVFSKLLEGGFFTMNSGLRVRVAGNVIATKATSAASSTVIKIKYNGTIISTVTTPGAAGGNNLTSAFQFQYDTYIVNAASLTTQTAVTEYITLATDYNLISGTIQYAAPSTGIESTLANSVDTSQPGLLEISFTLASATATINTTYTGSIIEKIG